MVKKLSNIGIVGAGFSGLSTAWYLLNLPKPPRVTLYSKGKIASRISAGLLHKYMGLYAKLNPIAVAAENETLRLLKIAQAFSNVPLIISKGFIRPGISAKQLEAYRKCAELYLDVEWLENCTSLDVGAPSGPGLFISSGLVIDTEAYLDGLIKACQSKGLIIEDLPLESEDYDHIIYAMGAKTPASLHSIKGQLIEIEWPSTIPPLPFTLIGGVYITMTPDSKKAVIGATYEHTFENEEPDETFAINFLYPKALELYPSLEGAKVLTVKSGLRGSTPNRLPLVQILSDKHSVICGMGSRGLLYHAYFANQLVNKLSL